MPEFSCTIANITKVTCDGQAGVAAIFVTTAGQIDFGATTISGRTITAWTMEVGGSWAEVSAERRNARVDFLYSEENGYYECSALNMVIRGQEEARTTNLENLKQCCDLIVQVHYENGVTRVFGRDYRDGGWIEPVTGARITRLLQTSGAFGAADDRVRDEFDIIAEQSTPPLYSSVDIATMQGL